MRTHDVYTHKVYAHGMHARDMLACDIHVYRVHAYETHAVRYIPVRCTLRHMPMRCFTASVKNWVVERRLNVGAKRQAHTHPRTTPQQMHTYEVYAHGVYRHEMHA
jgi:hypothetical protein